MKPLYPFLEQRRSVRHYDGRPVPPEVLARVAGAVTLAPAAHHGRHWHVAVITSPDVKHDLAAAMASAWDADLAAEGMPAVKRQRLTARNFPRFTQPPALVLLSADTRILPPPGRRDRPFEELMAVQSVAASGFAVLLAAAAEGLGAAWHCPPLYCPAAVRAVLGLPEYLWPQLILTLGYAAEQPGPRPERPLTDALQFFA